MNRPNLFKYATSELSQDAFISWLISWASPEFASVNLPLHKTGKYVLDKMFELSGVEKPSAYESVKVETQYEKIDVLVIINGEIPIIIEDKTHTSEHSGQLDRYFEKMANEYDSNKIVRIYLKTGDQSSYETVENAGYALFLRPDFVNVLEYGEEAGVENDIFSDFHEHLRAMDARVHAYRTMCPKDWDGNAWTGFFIELKERLRQPGEEPSWDYVSNPSGGFMGFWWHWRNGQFLKYLQLEEANLCFKIEVTDAQSRAKCWEDWHQALMSASSQTGLPLKRPARRRSGRWMTVALLNGEYLQTRQDALIDVDATVERLRKAEELLDLAVQNREKR